MNNFSQKVRYASMMIDSGISGFITIEENSHLKFLITKSSIFFKYV